MAPKDMMKTVLSDSDDTGHHANVDYVDSLDLSSTFMSVEYDDDDDFEMGRRTRQQHDENKGISNNNTTRENNKNNIKRPSGPENHETDAENEIEQEDDDSGTTILEIIYKTWSEAHWMFQVVATIWSCFWTYALIHNGDGGDVDVDAADSLIWDPQIAIMVVLVLTGVSCPVDLFAPVGVGVFAGAVPLSVVPTYAALTVLAVMSAVVWRLVSYTGFLAGFGGRMGTTTFIAMNLTDVLFLIPFGQMQDGWNAYGQPNWRNSSGSSRDSDNDDSENILFEWDQAIVLVCSTTFLSVAGASFRIRAPRQAPVHPFLTPCALALACDLLVAATVPHHRLAPTAYVGFSVGSYVAMAALTNLPNNEIDFFLSGLVAGWMGVLIDPFFVDFGGKAGFTAFLGYATYKYMIMPLFVQFLSRCKLRQLLPAITAWRHKPMLPFPLGPMLP